MEYGDLTLGQIEELISKLGGMDGVCRLLAGEVVVSATKNYFLKLVSGGENIVIPPTDGTETLAKAKDFFVSIEQNFVNWKTDEPGPATPETPVRVYEMVKDATLRQMFGSLGDLNTLCLTQAQIKAFVRDYRQWLCKDGYATFFLFISDNGFFVARVCVELDGRFHAGVLRLEDDCVWNADCRRRVVVP